MDGSHCEAVQWTVRRIFFFISSSTCIRFRSQGKRVLRGISLERFTNSQCVSKVVGALEIVRVNVCRARGTVAQVSFFVLVVFGIDKPNNCCRYDQ